MRVHLILSNQKIFNSIVCVEVFLASSTFPLNLALSLPVLRCVEVVQKNRDKGSLGFGLRQHTNPTVQSVCVGNLMPFWVSSF